MRIISDFRDYYDPIQRTIYDKSVIYNRKLECVGESNNAYRFSRIQSINVYFCGRRYLGIGLCEINACNVKWYSFSYEKLLDYYNNHIEKIGTDVFRYTSLPQIKERFDICNREQIVASDSMWEKYHSPIIVIRPDTVQEVNANLHKYNFEVVKDPYTAFQDIYTYLGGKASPEKEIPEMSNKDKISAKGFDKFSFRKERKP